MANKSLFASLVGRLLPTADARNEAGGVAYGLTPKQALAQYAATGCLNSTFYASADEQLSMVLTLAAQVEPEFVARTALHCRAKGHMKDMPALLVAYLSVRSPGLMAEVFDRVIDTPKMLRNFVQIMRSGAVGRKSLGTLPKRMVIQWLAARSDEQIFFASVGNSPSLVDVLKMVHPKPATAARAALYGYLMGKPHEAALLPAIVQAFEAFKANPSEFEADEMPDVPMEMLTGLALGPEHWQELARRASWQRLRMNLNTFVRQGAFNDPAVVALAAEKLRDPMQIAKARAFPYQLMAAFTNADENLPGALKEALQDAMEIAISRVPAVSGKVWVFPDVSGSMHSAITGHRKGSTSKIRCVDVAALVTAAIVRRNQDAGVLPFESSVVRIQINARDSVMTNAQRLASLPSGGTNCAAPLAYLNQHGLAGDLIIYVSDNESWLDSVQWNGSARTTETLAEWQRFKRRNPGARLVCLDLQPNRTTQAKERQDILNIGGFADSVFTAISEFSNGTLHPDHWVGVIEQETL